MKISEELIKKARQTNLAEYLMKKGELLHKSGNRHRHTEHDSLIFTDNAYYWNSRNEHGNAIDYLTRHCNMDFETAVRELTGIDTDTQSITTTKDFSFDDISICGDMRRVFAYLHKTRCIDNTLIEQLIKSKHIFQENETNNIIFPMYDENQNTVGAETTGTLSDKRFKGVKTGSKYGYGFNIAIGNKPFEYALFFESAIDVISFIEIERIKGKKLPSCLLVSMAGLKENVINHTVNIYNAPQNALKAILCVDNDEAGETFKKNLIVSNFAFKALTPNQKFKDWNDELKNIKNIKEMGEVNNESKPTIEESEQDTASSL